MRRLLYIFTSQASCSKYDEYIVLVAIPDLLVRFTGCQFLFSVFRQQKRKKKM